VLYEPLLPRRAQIPGSTTIPKCHPPNPLSHPDFSGFLCGAGDKGKRMALPNARFLLQTPKLEDMGLSQVSRSQTEAAFTIGRCEYKFG